ncbi:hypothetical protein [Actinomadura sp. GTD37]|uniref:hypothetical protein n=1 Tax=Actinomadura sp. GTD37 TaxID=1778030 RepID=UPI0035BFC293
MAMFHMTSDSDLFHAEDILESAGWTLDGNIFRRDGQQMLPLYEAKMIHHFDSRFGTFEGRMEAQANVGTLPRLSLEAKRDPQAVPLPRYWICESEVQEKIANRISRTWTLGWRDITSAGNERTMVSSLVPVVAVGNTLPLMISDHSKLWLLYANLTSFALDYVVRQKNAGSHLNYFTVKQLPVLRPDAYGHEAKWSRSETVAEWIRGRVLELTYTAHDLDGFAAELGSEQQPFVWDEDRRFAMRAELDAAYFHLYGVARHDASYIMDTFGAFQRNDPEGLRGRRR